MRRRSVVSSPNRARLRFEQVEARVAPATFTVTSTTDDGPGTLRAAIDAAEAAPDPDTIVFDPAISDGYPSPQLEPRSVGDTSVGQAAYKISTPITIDG